jgi:hypothetical protein
LPRQQQGLIAASSDPAAGDDLAIAAAHWRQDAGVEMLP